MPEQIKRLLLLVLRSFPATGLALLAVLVPASLAAQTSSANEDDIRAAMISHLPMFVEWPAGKADPAHPAFTLCLLGSDPLRAALEAQLQNKTLLSLPVVIQKVSARDKIDNCYILYVGATSKNELPGLMPALKQASVLVVSERSLASQKGQVIGLPIEDTHIRIEVDLALAQSSRLVISSRLLHLASVVDK